MEINEQRLERIESKLDKVSYSVADFARIEERLLSAFKRLERHEKQIDRHAEDIKTLTSSVHQTYERYSLEAYVWIVVTASISLGVYLTG